MVQDGRHYGNTSVGYKEYGPLLLRYSRIYNYIDDNLRDA